jgi:foldase protein PrsA
MKRYRSRLLALGAFFVVAIAVSACGSDVPGNSVADVAGNPITTQAFDHWLFVAAKSQAAQNPGSPVIVPDPPTYDKCLAQVRHYLPNLAKTPAKTIRADCKQLFTSYASQVMQFLIQGYWYQLEANRTHVKVTNADVQNAFNTAKKTQFTSDSQFETFLSSTGQTLQDILFRFRINTIAAKLVAKQTKPVTAADIANYYRTHVSQFGSLETRDIRIVLTKTAAEADAAKAALASGQSWNAVAKKYSIDPTTKDHGGLLTGVTKGQQDPALDDPAFVASLNKLEGPVKGQFGYYVFEVTKITPATQQTLAKATPLIRQTLTSQGSTNAQNAVTKQMKEQWLSQTTCRAGYNTTAFCKGYKAPKTATTPTTTGG